MNIVRRIALAICEDVGTPRALTCATLIRNNEWEQLARITCSPGNYTNPLQYFSDVVVTDLLRKSADLPTGINRRKAAIDNFWAAEAECARTNARLYRYVHSMEGHDAIFRMVREVRKDIESIVGTRPQLDPSRGRFGPGATFADKGKLTTVADKMMSQPTTTNWKIPVLWGWQTTAWARALQSSPSGCHVNTSRGNRFTSVPKDATKDRGICIEPSINIFYQLALGDEIRSKLRRHGLDLRYAQEVHRRLASVASRMGHLSTIDLSNASDTVAISLVRLFLPSKWFEALEEHRSRFTFLDGKWILLNKFSSMGNGFTFELETLIFWALARWSCRNAGLSHDDAYAYGDDIIVPTEAVATLLAALKFFGFTPNQKKTFTSGPFRESCGGDYFNGKDVRPFYLKNDPSTPVEWIAFANGLRLLRRKFLLLGADDPIKRAWFMAVANVPLPYRNCRGPESLGDSVIHDEKSTWNIKVKDGMRFCRSVKFSADYVGLSLIHI